MHDVWYSADGVKWFQATGAAAFPIRSQHSSLVFNNRMWVIAGANGPKLRDVWSSADGAAWVKATDTAAFTARYNPTSVVLNGRMWVIAGYDTGYKKDVWYSAATAANTLVDLNLPTTEVTMETTAYTLPATGEAQYNDSTFYAKPLTWSIISGDGSLSGNLYTRGTSNGTVELLASCSEHSKTVSRKLIIHVADWTQASASAGFTARKLHANLIFKDKMWVIGGQCNGSDKNDVWSSSNGITWSQETPGADFSARYGHTCLTFDDKMWVIGGYTTGQGFKNDVWFSSNGITWFQATLNAAFDARMYHSSLVFDNKMWVLGGFSNVGSYHRFSEAWCSTDGVTWTRATGTASFSARDYHSSLTFDNKMWVIGGSTGSDKNDVWYSSDGISWFQATAGAAFTPRTRHTSLVFDNKMWVIGGGAPSYANDVWYSSDGISWLQATVKAEFSARTLHTSLVYEDRMWVIGGSDSTGWKNDVWCSLDTAEVTPVDINLPTTEVTMETSATFALPLTAEIQYNNGTFTANNLTWTISTGSGEIVDHSYSPGGSNGTVELSAGYSEHSVTVSRKIIIHVADWIQATASAAFDARRAQSSIVFNNKMWVIGGDDASANKRNDVWYSSDGVTWTQATASAGFSIRSEHSCQVFDGKLWVIGGHDGTYKNDVWYSTDGAGWTQATAGAAFSAREKLTSLAFDNRIWVIGGIATGGLFKKDVWYSTDGAGWTQASTDAGFSNLSDHSSIVFNNQMWVIGGGNNSAWYSSDGVTWTQATAAAAFSSRDRHTSLVFNDRMWVIGGIASAYMNDVWSSIDGITWTRAALNAEFSPRYNHSSIVFNNRMWVISGYSSISPLYRKDVWYSAATAEVMPLYLETYPKTLEVATGGTLELSTISKKVFHNDGSSHEANSVTYQAIGGGSINGSLYTAPGTSCEATIEVDYTENGHSISTHIRVTCANWILSTASAAFPARNNHSSLIYDNKMWVIGGDINDSPYYANDVWYSSDGITWTQATAHAAFTVREQHTSLAYDHKMWVIGGNNGSSRFNDVYYSTDGADWTPATADADFSARKYHTSLVFDNKMWVIGGQDSTGYVHDVWYSIDGSQWTLATSEAAFPARTDFTSAVYDGKMWLIGGYGTGAQKDIWYSSDGITWTQTADMPSNRQGHTSIVFDNKLWVIAGSDGGNYYNDITYYSISGGNWNIAAAGGFSVRKEHTSLVFNNKIWVIGGFNWPSSLYNDVWHSVATVSSTPVDIGLSFTTVEIGVNQAYNLLPTAEIEYNDGTFISHDLNWVKSGNGTLAGNVFTAPGTAGTTELTASYAENGVTLSKTLEVVYLDNSKTKVVDLGGGVNMEFVWIPSGSFTMGGPASEGGESNERPTHEVNITKGFWLAKTEVTQAQWKQIMGNNPSYFTAGYPNCPVEQVSWTDCQSFITSLEVHGYGTFRLPTEAEWEYACRAGVATAYYWGAAMNDSYCWYSTNSGSATHDVGGTTANAWGLYDMSGNVWEWCNDWYDPSYYTSSPTVDPSGPAVGTNSVVRGGSWDNDAWYARSSSRNYADPGSGSRAQGLRLLAVPAGTKMPVEIELSATTAEIGTNQTYNLPATAEIQYNDGTFTSHNLTWSITSGGGAVGSNIFTAPGTAGTTEITASYAENGVPVSRVLKVHSNAPLIVDLGSGVNMEFVYIQSGSFTMGGPASEGGGSNERPTHEVHITKGFWLGKTEVTQAQWLQIMGNTPSYFPAGYPNCPVEQVSWTDCQSFITSLEVHGYGTFRLPTEAEWEYACRAGTATAYYWGAAMNGAYCWYTVNSSSKTHDAGGTTPNFWGLYDMAGNVWEWCNDWYLSNYYSTSPADDPQGPVSGSYRVMRGGSWYSTDHDCRSAIRPFNSPDYKYSDIGLRLAIPPQD
ncbi:MAG: SUMF1/EgtB/PvdO family nonheme iron enzyme [Candidatus Wallbacteria bacterium]|nr:SUMF1/EgtB/PvdO family nonheme iron enzyme [Candidatus Wallbacteria bacterium]